MGLRQRRQVLVSALRGIWPAWAVIAVSAVLELGGEPVRAALRYERSGLLSGELWRVLTGHFVHLGPMHLMLNAVGTLLVAILMIRALSPGQWCIVTAAVIGSIGLGFWLLNPSLEWYVGLSGLLHGWFAAGIVGLLRHDGSEGWPLAFLLAGKLAIEQWYGAIPGSSEFAGGPVVIDAHLYGAAAGLLTGILLTRFAGPRHL